MVDAVVVILVIVVVVVGGGGGSSGGGGSGAAAARCIRCCVCGRCRDHHLLRFVEKIKRILT